MDTPILLELSGVFVAAQRFDMPDIREFFRSLSADLGYDPQLDPSNEFSWAFHDATFDHAHRDSLETTVTVSATIAHKHPRALVPLVYWACQSLVFLGEFHLHAVSLRFPEGLGKMQPRQAFRHLPSPPASRRFPFVLEVDLPTVYDDQLLGECINRISQMPFPAFIIDSVSPLQRSATTPNDPIENWWQLSGCMNSWNYLEIGYLLYTIQSIIPGVMEIRLIRK
ncbi:MAG: hypothetical protein PUK59_03320 [Actinomycetaceae bacterium]|nr:hypothetical protein [Actinomycetaceae bacterium]MDY5855318.1 hypothetical protein [Arcanobacterium sp.]